MRGCLARCGKIGAHERFVDHDGARIHARVAVIHINVNVPARKLLRKELAQHILNEPDVPRHAERQVQIAVIHAFEFDRDLSSIGRYRCAPKAGHAADHAMPPQIVLNQFIIAQNRGD